MHTKNHSSATQELLLLPTSLERTDHILLALQKITIQITAATECTLLVYHPKVQKSHVKTSLS